MAKSGSLNLDDCPPVACWLATADRLRADGALAASGVRLEFWDGHPESVTRLADVQSPAVRFYPFLGPLAWHDEGRMVGQLIVDVEAVLFRLDPVDAMNLNAAVLAALYPADGGLFVQSLIDAEAATGLWAFQRSLGQPQASRVRENLYRLTGQLALAVHSAVLST